MYLWSQTPASNATADPSINWRENQAPSSINDSARNLMARMAAWRDDINGSLATTGTSNAYALSSNEGFNPSGSGSLADNVTFAFRPHVTNAAGATMNVDSTGNLPLRIVSGQSIPAGYLIAGTPYRAIKLSAEILVFGAFGNPYNIPIGGLLPYTGDAPPNSNFVFPYGQAISRTAYSDYFGQVGTTFGPGDGSTTFNILDLRGRVIAGLDNMGGSAAGRITGAGSGIDGTTLGAVGGAEKLTLPRSALPNVQLGGSTSVNGNHDHNYTRFNILPAAGSGGSVQNLWANQSTQSTTTDGAHNHSITTDSINGGVTQTAVNKMPPAIILPMILRVI